MGTQPFERPVFELSQDDGTNWEKLVLPTNSLPFHQCVLLGKYEENGNKYRKAKK